MKIGMRTVKTAIASGLSMAVAQAIGLLYAPAAGIIAILSVGNTKENIALYGHWTLDLTGTGDNSGILQFFASGI